MNILKQQDDSKINSNSFVTQKILQGNIIHENLFR